MWEVEVVVPLVTATEILLVKVLEPVPTLVHYPLSTPSTPGVISLLKTLSPFIAVSSPSMGSSYLTSAPAQKVPDGEICQLRQSPQLPSYTMSSFSVTLFD